MTPEQISLVKISFERVVLVKHALATAFYQELFRIAPQVRPIFPEEIAQQEAKLADTLDYVVEHLVYPDRLQQTLVSLAQRHVTYGAEPGHFAAVGIALITALKKTVPGGLTPAEQNAWHTAFAFIADTMIAEFPAKSA